MRGNNELALALDRISVASLAHSAIMLHDKNILQFSLFNQSPNNRRLINGQATKVDC